MTVGATVTVRQEGGVVTLTNAEGGTVQLKDDYAHAIRVAVR
jgi:DtxR family Mn-dependent transcriptional regulator